MQSQNACHLSKTKSKLKAKFSDLPGALHPGPPPGLCPGRVGGSQRPPDVQLNFKRLCHVQRLLAFVLSDGRIFSGF